MIEITHPWPAAIMRPFVQPVPAALMENGAVTVSAGVPKVSEAPVLFVSVILEAALDVPTAVAGNVSEVGAKATKLVPVPVIPTSCGLLGSLSRMTNAPFFAPVAFGAKTTLTVHFAPAAKVLPEAGQVLAEIAKSASLREMIPIVTLAVLVLATVTTLAALVVPTP